MNKFALRRMLKSIGAAVISIFLFLVVWQISTTGTEFGKQYSNFVRMNFSQDHDKAVSAVERICEMVERYRA